MRRILLAIVFAVAFVPQARAAIILDQAHELTEFVSQGGVGGNTIDENVAQTVRVGVSGQLVTIQFWANRTDTGSGDLVLDIRPTELDGSPVENDLSSLAQVVIPRSDVSLLGPGNPPAIAPLIISLDLTAFDLFFQAGDAFAFNFTNPDSNSVGGFGVLGNFGPGGSSGPYSDGKAFLRRTDLMNGEFYAWDGGSDTVGPVDLGFRTFVDTDATVIPEPTTLAIWSLLGGIGLVVGHRRRSVRSDHNGPPSGSLQKDGISIPL